MTKRPYDASGRRAAAEERRLRIAATAADLFAERGWAGTTLAEVAARCEVSPDLVASAFGGKAGLLMAALRRIGFGAHRDLGSAFAALELDSEPDKDARLDKLVALASSALPAMAPLASVLLVAADQDPELRLLVRASEEGLGRIAREVVRLLGSGEVCEDAVDEVYVLMRSETFQALTRYRGWSTEQYAAWLRRSLIEAVAPPERRPQSLSR